MEEGEGTSEENSDIDIATTASSLGGSGVFHIVYDMVGCPLYAPVGMQIPTVLQDMSLEFDGLQREFMDLTIRALISTGAGSTSYPGAMRLFILVHASPTLNLPQHFLPKRDFQYNRKFVPSKLKFKCKTEDNTTNSQLNSNTNDRIWFQCRHVIKGLAFHQPVEK